ncbi:MAG: glycosyltransferase [Flavobacteriaceae bacterium]
MRRRKIVFLVNDVMRDMGGAERYGLELAVALRRRGHDVTMLSRYPRDAVARSPLPPDLPVENLPREAGPLWFRLAQSVINPYIPKPLRDYLGYRAVHARALRRWLAKRRPRVVVAFESAEAIQLATAIRSLRPRPRTIASLHTSIDRDFGLLADGFMPLNRALLGPSLERLDAVHVLLPAYARRIAEIQPFGEAIGARTVAIPGKVEPGRAFAGDPASRLVVAVGRLAPVKDHDTLIRAFAVVGRTHPGWRLSILGDGPLRAHLQSLVDSLDLAGVVTLEGQRRDVGAFLSRAAIFAMPSRHEGFSRALAEAVGAGLPSVVFADCSGNNEFVAGHEIGILAEPADRVSSLAAAIGRLIDDGGLRSRLARNARALAEGGAYSGERMVDEWERLIDAVAAPGPFSAAEFARSSSAS